jgi:hypothetical protein
VTRPVLAEEVPAEEEASVVEPAAVRRARQLDELVELARGPHPLCRARGGRPVDVLCLLDQSAVESKLEEAVRVPIPI